MPSYLDNVPQADDPGDFGFADLNVPGPMYLRFGMDAPAQIKRPGKSSGFLSQKDFDPAVLGSSGLVAVVANGVLIAFAVDGDPVGRYTA